MNQMNATLEHDMCINDVCTHETSLLSDLFVDYICLVCHYAPIILPDYVISTLLWNFTKFLVLSAVGNFTTVLKHSHSSVTRSRLFQSALKDEQFLFSHSKRSNPVHQRPFSEFCISWHQSIWDPQVSIRVKFMWKFQGILMKIHL